LGWDLLRDMSVVVNRPPENVLNSYAKRAGRRVMQARLMRPVLLPGKERMDWTWRSNASESDRYFHVESGLSAGTDSSLNCVKSTAIV
jgi:hypothetical protein